MSIHGRHCPARASCYSGSRRRKILLAVRLLILPKERVEFHAGDIPDDRGAVALVKPRVAGAGDIAGLEAGRAGVLELEKVFAVDGAVGVEELVSDVGQDGGAAGGDAAFGDEDHQPGEELVDVDGGVELGEFGEEVGGEVFRIVLWRLGHGGAQGGRGCLMELVLMASRVISCSFLGAEGGTRVCVATTSRGHKLCAANHSLTICCGRDEQKPSTHTDSYTLRHGKKSA